MKSDRRMARLSNALRKSQTDLTVVLENIHDPHNVSAILRTCDAVGVRKAALLYTAEVFPRIGKKSSASAYKWVDREKFDSVESCFKKLRNDGFVIAASVLKENAVPLFELDLRQKIALVFGNEHRGVSEEASSRADLCFQIPMFGMIQSLNVSVASAVTLYEALRQRSLAEGPPRPGISEREFERLLAEWVKK